MYCGKPFETREELNKHITNAQVMELLSIGDKEEKEDRLESR